MAHVRDGLERVLRGDQSPQRTWLEPYELPKPTATSEQILQLVTEVEAVKQLNPPLTLQQRGVLVAELLGLKLSLDELREMAESVKLSTTYGGIALEHWLGTRVALKSEIDGTIRVLHRQFETAVTERARALVDCRLKEARQALDPARERVLRRLIEVNTMEDACQELAKKRAVWEEDCRQEARKRLARARGILVAMNKETRRKVMERAVAEGRMKSFDASIIENIGYFADLLYPIVEDWKS